MNHNRTSQLILVFSLAFLSCVLCLLQLMRPTITVSTVDKQQPTKKKQQKATRIIITTTLFFFRSIFLSVCFFRFRFSHHQSLRCCLTLWPFSCFLCQPISGTSLQFNLQISIYSSIYLDVIYIMVSSLTFPGPVFCVVVSIACNILRLFYISYMFANHSQDTNNTHTHIDL